MSGVMFFFLFELIAGDVRDCEWEALQHLKQQQLVNQYVTVFIMLLM
jgi:hypothetical protein